MSFAFTVNDGAGEKVYLKVLVEQALVKKISLSGPSAARLQETVEFEFGKITWTYYTTPGSTADFTQSTWDYTTNAAF